jgi:hypothetical protein
LASCDPEPPEISIHLFTGDENLAVGEGVRDLTLEDTVVRGVRMNLFGPDDWPKHVIELGYQARHIRY